MEQSRQTHLPLEVRTLVLMQAHAGANAGAYVSDYGLLLQEMSLLTI